MEQEPPQIDPDASPEERKRQLKEAAKKHKQEYEAAHSEMLDAVAQGKDSIAVEDYEWVQLGDVRAKVKTWLPGDTQDTIQDAYRIAQRENLEDTTQSVSLMVDGMTDVTEALEWQGETFDTDDHIRKFWKGMYGQWGVQGFQQSAERVLEPANHNQEELKDAANGFRQDAERSRPGDYE